MTTTICPAPCSFTQAWILASHLVRGRGRGRGRGRIRVSGSGSGLGVGVGVGVGLGFVPGLGLGFGSCSAPLVLLSEEVSAAHVDEVHHRLGRDQAR